MATALGVYLTICTNKCRALVVKGYPQSVYAATIIDF